MANEKGTIAKLATSALETNKKAATSAAIFAAGNVANKTLVKLVSPKLPMMTRGYLDTPLGRLVLANIVKMALDQFKPDHAAAQRLANGMIVAAYSEAIASFDIEGLIDNLLGDAKIAKALATVDEAE